MAEAIPTLRGMTHPRWYGGVGAFVVLLGAIGLFGGIDGLRASPQKLGLGIAGIGAFVVSIAIMVLVSKLVRRELTVDGEGVQVRTKKGVLTRIRWDEPHDLYLRAIAPVGLAKAAMPSMQKVSVRAPDGRRIDVDDVRIPGNPNAGVPELASRCSTAASWPRISARLDAGEDVDFGVLRLSRTRVRIGSKELPLTELSGTRVDKGELEILGANGRSFGKVWVRNVANYPSLMRALDRR
jgi:uncharacterized protein DUF6585